MKIEIGEKNSKRLISQVLNLPSTKQMLENKMINEVAKYLDNLKFYCNWGEKPFSFFVGSDDFDSKTEFFLREELAFEARDNEYLSAWADEFEAMAAEARAIVARREKNVDQEPKQEPTPDFEMRSF